MVSATSLEWLQTLADSTRVRLLHLLEGQELSVSELCSVVQLPQSTVSRHLRVLAADDWIDSRREGTNHLYQVVADAWCEARRELWNWVRAQADGPTTAQDRQRLRQILVQRSRSEAFFTSTADHWDSVRVDLFGPQIDAFSLAAALPEDAVVAELGCGSAPICRLIAPFVREAIAVDNSAAMMTTARQQLGDSPNVRFVESSLTNINLQPETLDAAWLVLVLPYLDDPVAVVAEACRVLKPGSPLIVVDLRPHERTAYRQEMGHVRLGVDRNDLEDWFQQADLQMTKYHELPPDPSAKGPSLFTAVGKRAAA